MTAAAAELKKRLEKKATFEAAVKDLNSRLQSPGVQEPALVELLELCSRVHALLKARYSNPAFFRAGLDLYKTAIACASATPSVRQNLPQLTKFVAEAEAFLGSDSEQPEPARRQTLGELLLGLPPPQETVSHLSDAGLVLDAPRAAAPAVAAAAATVPPAEASETATAPSIDELLQRLQQHNALDQSTGQQQQPSTQQEHSTDQQQQQQPPQHNEAVLLETLAGQLPRAELEALLARFTEEAAAHQQPSRPPASKHAVASLPTVTLTDAAALESVGGPSVSCPVCTEELQLQEQVQQLPCKHVFHVPCLKPWLDQNNSCPVCRHELPTDDHVYEARKEREAEEDEARRGAAAALSHNEFMYV